MTRKYLVVMAVSPLPNGTFNQLQREVNADSAEISTSGTLIFRVDGEIMASFQTYVVCLDLAHIPPEIAVAANMPTKQ